MATPAYPRSTAPVTRAPAVDGKRSLPGDEQPLSGRERQTLRLVKIAIIVTLVLQRVQFAGAPAAILVAYALVVILWRRGLGAPHPTRWRLYLAAMGACSLAAMLSSLGIGAAPSVTSVLLLVVTYLPLCWVVDGGRRLHCEVLRYFVKVMSVIALITIAEWGAQLLGWVHQDFVAQVLPPNLLYGDFNTNYPVSYGSPILKPNAFVFLEPSVCSQFLALGLLGQLILRPRPTRIALFGLAIMATVSGTGVILLLVGVAAIAASRGVKFAVVAALLAALVVVVLPMTPVSNLFRERATETSAEGSSGNLRFVAPYQLLYSDTLTRGVVAELVGQGPGAGDRQAARYFNDTGQPLVPATVAKLVIEYGIPATLVFLVFFGFVVVRNAPSGPFAAGLVVMYLVLQGALLQPLVPYTCMLLSGLYPAERHSRPGNVRS